MKGFEDISKILRKKLKMGKGIPTPSEEANAISTLLSKYGKSITDTTACVGGTVASFAKKFERVNAIELDAECAGILQHNMHVLGLRTVNVVSGDCIAEISKLKQEVIFIDPPSDPKSQKINLFLSGMNIEDICKVFSSYASVIAIRAPKNFDMATFIHNIIDDFEIIDFMSKFPLADLIVLKKKA